MSYPSFRQFFVFAFAIFSLIGCKPDDILVNLYTTDVDVAADGEVVEIPVTAKFSLLGEDDDGSLERAVKATQRYLHPDTKFTRSQSEFSETLVVETLIPLGTQKALKNYFTTNASVAYLELFNNTEFGGYEITLYGSKGAASLHQTLQGINFMLGFDLPAGSTVIRVISDSRKKILVEADAVFVSSEPHLYFSTDLERRDEVNIEFKGGDDSIWSAIAPVIYVQP